MMCFDFLKSRSEDAWLQTVLSDFNHFLVDHAACERKASATCMSFVVRYPDQIQLADTMIRLAREELSHFHEVFHLMEQRGLKLGPDTPDEYVNKLLAHSRTGREERLMDRLILSGIIEARGCERFYMISQALKEPELQKFYEELAHSEHRHHLFFINLAEQLFPKHNVQKRVDELLELEAAIVKSLPLKAILH